jgi:hypothetical protein
MLRPRLCKVRATRDRLFFSISYVYPVGFGDEFREWER